MLPARFKQGVTGKTLVRSIREAIPPPEVTFLEPPPESVPDGASPPTSVCTVDHNAITSLYQQLYNAGIVESPEIPQGYTTFTKDGWGWTWTGHSWEIGQYMPSMDLRLTEQNFSC